MSIVEREEMRKRESQTDTCTNIHTPTHTLTHTHRLGEGKGRRGKRSVAREGLPVITRLQSIYSYTFYNALAK